VVLTRTGRLPENAHLFTDAHRDRTLVFRGKSLRSVLRELGRLGVTSVLIEGGANVLAQAFDARLVDRVQFHYAPLLVGGPAVCLAGKGARSARVVDPCYEKAGRDLVVTGDVCYPASKRARNLRD
jgi:diaminohydroxyphosphoribosylaminopyrimidine deaminase/5-amino-6-(5-phosphoribosylamino)uracil reductase